MHYLFLINIFTAADTAIITAITTTTTPTTTNNNNSNSNNNNNIHNNNNNNMQKIIPRTKVGSQSPTQPSALAEWFNV
jgi:hypothetical protein